MDVIMATTAAKHRPGWERSRGIHRELADARFALQHRDVIADYQRQREQREAELEHYSRLERGMVVLVLPLDAAQHIVDCPVNATHYRLYGMRQCYRRDELIVLPAQPTEFTRRWFAFCEHIKITRNTPDKIIDFSFGKPLRWWQPIPINMPNRLHVLTLRARDLLPQRKPRNERKPRVSDEERAAVARVRFGLEQRKAA